MNKMDKINKIVKSESLSSYLSCYSNDDESNVPRTKIFANTKARLFMRRVEEDRILTKNGRELKLNSVRSYDQSPETSTSTLRSLQQRNILEQHHLMKHTFKEKFSGKSPSKKYTKQTSLNQPFDVDRFRRLSNRAIASSSIMKTSTRTEQKYFASKHCPSATG